MEGGSHRPSNTGGPGIHNLPCGLGHYDRLGFLSNEVRSRLKQVRPRTVATLKRMEGITPDAIIRLMRYVKDKNLKPRPDERESDDKVSPE